MLHDRLAQDQHLRCFVNSVQASQASCMAHLPLLAICGSTHRPMYDACELRSRSRPGCLTTRRTSRATPPSRQSPRPSASWATGQRPLAWPRPPCLVAAPMRHCSRSSLLGRHLALSAPWAYSEVPLKVGRPAVSVPRWWIALQCTLPWNPGLPMLQNRHHTWYASKPWHVIFILRPDRQVPACQDIYGKSAAMQSPHNAV